MPGSSSREETTVRLSVTTADAASEIFLIDGRFSLVARGCGALVADLEPGIYKVKVAAGQQVEERHVILGPADGPVEVHFDALNFSSPAPLERTAKASASHAKAADQQSRRLHPTWRRGGSIFFFVRDWQGNGFALAPARERYNPAAGLTLHDARGRQTENLESRATVGRAPAPPSDDAESVASAQTSDHWAACCLHVQEGVYRLKLETGQGGALEQIIAVANGWQTQVFLLLKGDGDGAGPWRADLANAAVFMQRQGGFPAGALELRLTELVRLGLANQRMVLPPDLRADILDGSFDNPMLGLYAAHLLLVKARPDERPSLTRTVARLRSLVGHGHPDVEALALLDGHRGETFIFALPPMLRRSWALVLDASVATPGLVPLGTPASEAAASLSGEEPWLNWMDAASRPAAMASGNPESPAEAEAGLESALRMQMPRLHRTGLVRRIGDLPTAVRERVTPLGQEFRDVLSRLSEQSHIQLPPRRTLRATGDAPGDEPGTGVGEIGHHPPAAGEIDFAPVSPANAPPGDPAPPADIGHVESRPETGYDYFTDELDAADEGSEDGTLAEPATANLSDPSSPEMMPDIELAAVSGAPATEDFSDRMAMEAADEMTREATFRQLVRTFGVPRSNLEFLLKKIEAEDAAAAPPPATAGGVADQSAGGTAAGA